MWVALAFLAIQLIPIDRENKPVDKKNNFADIYKTPQNVRSLLKNACYDCHSDETVYPDYAYVAPISWAVKDHINEGREYLNFSEWGTYNNDIKQNAIRKSVETVKSKEMPLPSYINYHPGANLTTPQRKLLEDYFLSIQLK